ncbi:hypothetical protein BaRGS_00040119, partial [Batillaria attramentaria]
MLRSPREQSSTDRSAADLHVKYWQTVFFYSESTSAVCTLPLAIFLSFLISGSACGSGSIQ